MKTLRLHYVTTYTANNVNQYIVQNALFKSTVCFIWESILRQVLCVCLEVCKKTNKFKQSLCNFEPRNGQYFKQL